MSRTRRSVSSGASHGSRGVSRSRARYGLPEPLPQASRLSPRSGSQIDAAGLRALVDNSDDGMILADDEGLIVYANAACESVFGLPPERLIGRVGFELCRADHLSVARDAFGRALGGPMATASCVLDAVHADGGFRTVAVNLVNYLSSPSVEAIVVHLRETDPRDGPREAYRPLFDKALIGLGVADLQGRLLEFNDELMRPGGYTREDMLRLGNIAGLYARHADRARVLEILLHRGVVWREEVPFVRKDGSTYDTLLSLTPVRFRGRPCLYAIVEDVTRRKRAERERQQLEAQLAQARKMEAVGRMTAGIAHDFGNLVEVLLGSAELAAESLGRDDTSEARAHVADIRDGALRASAMVRMLLGYSRSAPLAVEPTELGPLAREMRRMIEGALPDDVPVEITVKDEVIALCDPRAVEQMILNLVTNAADATSAGGTVELVVDRFDAPEARNRPPWLPERHFARVSVVDTGHGMDPDTLGRATEPFFTTKPAGHGSGLGLAMVFGLVKQQGGYLQLTSKVGEGTAARLFFPSV